MCVSVCVAFVCVCVCVLVSMAGGRFPQPFEPSYGWQLRYRVITEFRTRYRFLLAKKNDVDRKKEIDSVASNGRRSFPTTF